MRGYDIFKQYWSEFDAKYLKFLNVSDIKEKYQLNAYIDEQKELLFASQ
jgi:hypothetical protein